MSHYSFGTLKYGREMFSPIPFVWPVRSSSLPERRNMESTVFAWGITYISDCTSTVQVPQSENFKGTCHEARHHLLDHHRKVAIFKADIDCNNSSTIKIVTLLLYEKMMKQYFHVIGS